MARRRLRGSGSWGQSRPYVSPWQGGSGQVNTNTGSGSSLSPAPTGSPITGPAPGPPPPDPIHTGQLGAINLNYDQTIAGIGFDRTALAQHYGFGADGNIDPSNPYSVVMNMQRRYQQGQAGTTNSMASAGQLYSGALQRNLDEGTYRYSRDYDTTRRQAASGYQDLTERQQAAEFARAMGISQADAERLLRLQG